MNTNKSIIILIFLFLTAIPSSFLGAGQNNDPMITVDITHAPTVERGRSVEINVIVKNENTSIEKGPVDVYIYVDNRTIAALHFVNISANGTITKSAIWDVPTTYELGSSRVYAKIKDGPLVYGKNITVIEYSCPRLYFGFHTDYESNCNIKIYKEKVPGTDKDILSIKVTIGNDGSVAAHNINVTLFYTDTEEIRGKTTISQLDPGSKINITFKIDSKKWINKDIRAKVAYTFNDFNFTSEAGPPIEPFSIGPLEPSYTESIWYVILLMIFLVILIGIVYIICK